jgi:hypothetical protein
MAKPIHLKEEGNRRFQAGDYVMAEALYSQAYGPLSPSPQWKASKTPASQTDIH